LIWKLFEIFERLFGGGRLGSLWLVKTHLLKASSPLCIMAFYDTKGVIEVPK
jgi:hypothetical protein